MKNMNEFPISSLVVVIVFVGLLVGWALSIYKLTTCDFQSPYKCEAMYGIGAFVPPAGAIIGWIPSPER